jgi:hypothetical protein
MKENGINKLHFLYIVGILIAIIICLLTIDFGNNQNLLEYLSFALTVTSLFLSLLAIIYAYYSNSSFSETISTLNKSSNDIAYNSKNLEEITKQLDIKFEKLPQLIKAIEEKVDITNAFLADQYERNNIAPNAQPDENLPQTFIDKFFVYSSTMGLYALYAAYLSHKNKITFTLKALNDVSDLLVVDYTMGFLTSASSFGVFSRADYSETWTITGFNNEIGQRIKDTVYKRAMADKEEDDKGYLYSQIDRIERYLGEKD